jgi:copper chaperone NosL
MKRRELLKVSMAALGATLSGAPQAATDQCATARSLDLQPLDNELEKYPRCKYCGMDRKQFHRSRVLVHYQDDSVEGTCSVRCLGVSLIQNLGRDSKALYVADFASTLEPRPLTDALQAIYLIGGEFPTAMTRRPKTAFAHRDDAVQARIAKGGELADFEQMLLAVYADLAEGFKLRRQRRAQTEALERG